MRRKWYIIDEVNPQPWAIGPLGVGRRPGGAYPFVGPNQQLVAYQKAVKEELLEFDIDLWPGEMRLEFFFWRRLETIRRTTKTSHSHVADATNLQKGLEDALQGILFENDRNVRSIQSTVVEQSNTTTPRIVICISSWEGMDPEGLPDFVWNAIDNTPSFVASDNTWGHNTNEDIF